jgi:hypothetical protein
MPISPITLQRRHAELGRIRLGDQKATQSGKTRPNKLSRFRFTSVSERYIHDLATLYGGEARPWDNNGIASWEVYSEAQSIPVIVVKGGLSQWMETWSGGGCAHRCDGQQQVDGTLCDPDDPQHQAAKPTTRLSLMLVELEAIGVWRCETHGWNAAAEIPAVAELAQFVGDLVPANLHLVERRSVKDGQTSRFVVPVLDLQIGTERLKEIVAQKSGQAPAEIGGSAPNAIEQARDPYAPYAQRVAAAKTIGDLQELWQEMVAEHLVGSSSQPSQARADFVEAYKAKGSRVQPAAPAAQQQVPDADGVVDAEIVEEDPDALWQQILAVGGQLGMSLADLNDEYAAQHGGESPDTATPAQLVAFRDGLKAVAA